ncbi:hypothetical protein CALCODRAFT_521347 [Calocera cornea HHB12733]|uniref:Meiotically up-regulated protein Msb1/Mug8 domain-containing protein n=1 Tax=Calocera cornea HHB12733 TaxID=1353952 RepID=A0A165CVJ1_9BASI|nr:hypothetical protein CALCODRAFT_521347 [Calocera cornea HHB12733]
MSIFTPRKKTPKQPPHPATDAVGLARTTSTGSANNAPFTHLAPVTTTISEFGHFQGTSSSHPRLLPPPTTHNQRRSDYDRALPAPPQHAQYLDARFPAERDVPDVPVTEVGYLAEGRQVTLGLATVTNLLQVVGKELEAKGLTTPLLFSTRALDLSAHRVRSLIRAFLRTVGRAPGSPDPEADRRWRDEVRFSGPHELGAVLRWALARVERLHAGVHLRGLVDIAAYDEWRSAEHAGSYRPDAFLAFPPSLPSQVQPLIAALFPLLSRFAANASFSGLSPVALANIFGPLLFGLGAPSQPFTATYNAYLASSRATEHLILAFIRLQDHELHAKAGAALPTRLKDWIRGYPSMLPAPGAPLDQPRQGAKSVRVISVRRNVRLYSPNLIQTASTWPAETAPDQPMREWTRIAGPGKTAQPLYAEDYRKRLDLPMAAVPTSPYRRVPPTPPPKERMDGTHVLGTIVIPEADKFKSLTDFRWGMFESSGFDVPDPKKLEFDLTESARKRQPSKRDTVAWSEFASVGFTREDFSLDFAPPVQETISTWPDHQAELHRKLRKQQKALPAFGWDTHPVHGRDKRVEETFIDCWADLLLSTGWMEREEQTFRDCNWVLVEYRAAPEQTSKDQRAPSTLTAYGSDNRSSSQWYVFEEFVPREYREDLLNPKKKKTGIFSVSGKTKKLIPMINTGGRAQTLSNAPRSPAREAEFERLIAAGDPMENLRRSPVPGPGPGPRPPEKPRLQISSPLQPGHGEGKLRKPPFPLHPSTSGGPLTRLKHLGRHSPIVSSEDTAVDVEFASASLSDHSDEQPLDVRGQPSPRKEQWVDVRLADRNKRQPELPASPVSQHAPPTPPRPQPTFVDDMEPVQFAQRDRLPTPEGPSPGSEYPVPDEYESDVATPLASSVAQVFPLPPGRSNRQGIIFPTAGPSPPESEDEEEQGDFEPYQETTEGSDSRHAEDEADVEDDADAATDMSGPDNAMAFDPSRPGGITMAQWQATRTASEDAKHASGVSSLIEMYQERDRQASLEPIPGPSRIPVRTTSPSNLPLAPPVRAASPVRTASPLTASPKGMQSTEGSALFEPDKIQASFPRYVHGAPLHNLIEAPEEETDVEEEA